MNEEKEEQWKRIIERAKLNGGRLHLYFDENLWIGEWEIIIKNIESCVEITSLTISGGAYFSYLPAKIGNLVSLTNLELDCDELTSLPENIGNLVNLTSFKVHGFCVSLPESIGNLVGLINLDISGYGANNLPKSISNLTKLKSLKLHCCEPGSILEDVFKLVSLTNLDLSSNKLNSFPEMLYRLDNIASINLNDNKLTRLPKSTSNLVNLTPCKTGNCIYIHPKNIGNLTNLDELFTNNYRLDVLLENIDNFVNLTCLDLSYRQLKSLPEHIGNLTNLTKLNLSENELTSLPESIGSLTNLTSLNLGYNQLTNLPHSIGNLTNLVELFVEDNELTNLLTDLSILQALPKLQNVRAFSIDGLPRRYWTKLSDWQPKWLLDENNAEIRRLLIQRIGYERICQELGAIEIDLWREYHLLRIEKIVDIEPMLLLKMTCPSTGHIHILRIPPDLTTAEAAITWVNHGVHPDEFKIQT